MNGSLSNPLPAEKMVVFPSNGWGIAIQDGRGGFRFRMSYGIRSTKKEALEAWPWVKGSKELRVVKAHVAGGWKK